MERTNFSAACNRTFLCPYQLVSLCKILLERLHGSISGLSLGTFLSLSYEAIFIIKFTRGHSDLCVSTHINLKYIQETLQHSVCSPASYFSWFPFCTSEFSATFKGSHMDVSFPPNSPASTRPRHSLVHQLQFDLYFILVLQFLKPFPQCEQVFPIISNRGREVSSRENLQSTVSKMFSKSEHQAELLLVDNMTIKL